MAGRDLHEKPFSEETLTRLDIFERYAKEWLPVFVMGGYATINICDLFAGPGVDAQGQLGSPLRILRVVEEHAEEILRRGIRINVVLNEFDPIKSRALTQVVDETQAARLAHLRGHLKIECTTLDFGEAFDRIAPLLRDQANLLFLDQNGIKQVTRDLLVRLDAFARTDFLFFISSSYFRRFSNREAFREYFPDIDPDEVSRVPYSDIHRFVLKYFRAQLPADSRMKLYPFSIRKGANIYGLVFGSKHPLGVSKFLSVAWKENSLNGEANFDIDDDAPNPQGLLFASLRKKTKLERFEEDLEHFLLAPPAGHIGRTNREVLDFALENGFLPMHAAAVVRRLKEAGRIRYHGQTRISYDSCYKEQHIHTFEVVNGR